LSVYAADGNVFALTKTAGRGEWLPGMGANTPRPIFVTLGKHGDFDKLIGSGRQTWYERWASVVLGQQMLLAKGWQPTCMVRLSVCWWPMAYFSSPATTWAIPWLLIRMP
jgi:hypothetical protein